VSPRRDGPTTDRHLPKRPLEGGDTVHVEKRARIDPADARTPSSSQKSGSRKPDSSATKPPPSRLGKSSDSASREKISADPRHANAGKQVEKLAPKPFSKPSEKPLNTLPPLLSPLPADLTGEQSLSNSSGFGNVKSSTSQPKTSSSEKAKSVSDGKKPMPKNHSSDSSHSSPLSSPPKSSPEFTLPPLLSPTLPPIVEQALENQKEEKARKAAALTVEARHEKARQPDTPGVARKTTGPKIGHPPKRSASSTPAKIRDAPKSEDREPKIVRLSYKKRQAKDIERILKMKPVPTKEFKAREAERLMAEDSVIVASSSRRDVSTSRGEPSSSRRDHSTSRKQASSRKDTSDSEDEAPLASVSSKMPAKKRPAPAEERPEPPAKRAKVPEKVDVARSRAVDAPAFKSPVASAPPPKTLLATPKKPEAIKSVAMRKVDSSDGHARTPQAMATSTAASAEKPRTNGDRNADIVEFRSAGDKYNELALKLKRKMDSHLKTKERGANPSASEKKLGLSTGVECISAYIMSYASRNQAASLGRREKDIGSWEGLVPLIRFMDNYAKRERLPVHLAVISQLLYSVLEEIQRLLQSLPMDSLNHHEVSASEEKERREKDAKNWAKMQENFKQKDKMWLQIEATRKTLDSLKIRDMEIVGSATSMDKATGYAMRVLEAFEESEKVGWKATFSLLSLPFPPSH